MADARRVVVVGGGIAGLSAARAALLRGREVGRPVEVTVLERSPRFGGNLVTERVDGFVLDAGPDSWVVTKPHATALARSLGLGDAIIGTRPESRRFYIAWGGRLHPVPEGLVLGVPTQIGPLAGTRLFSWAGKARMALEPFVPRRRFEGDDDESIADFATRRLGREAAERLVAPLLGGISAGDATDISVRAAFPMLVAMEQKHGSLVFGMRAARKARASSGGSAFNTLAGGTGSLVDALVARLRADSVALREGTGVEGIAREGGTWKVRLVGGGLAEADALLLAVPAYVAAPLLEGLDAEAAKGLATIGYGSTATVFFGYRRTDVTHPLDGVGFVVPRIAGRPILAGTWVSSKWEGRAPDGQVLVRVFLGGPAASGLLDQGDDELARVARVELGGLMGLEAEPTMTRVFRYARSSAQMRVGHHVLMRTVHARLAESAPGLAVAGGGYDGVGIPDCIRQGEEAGRAMVQA